MKRALPLFASVLAALAIAQPGIAGIYEADAYALIPPVSEIGGSLAQESSTPVLGRRGKGIVSAWQRHYETTSFYAVVSATVFGDGRDAEAAYAKSCPGCEPRTAPEGWRYKRLLERDSAKRIASATLVAVCGNVLMYGSSTGSSDFAAFVYAGEMRVAIAGMVGRALKRGLSPCWSPPRVVLPKARFYISEAEAEALAAAKIRIPWCDVWPDDRCRGIGYELNSVSCRGSDELGSTFTFYRFTCDFVAGRERLVRGKLAVWAAGPGRIKWVRL